MFKNKTKPNLLWTHHCPPPFCLVSVWWHRPSGDPYRFAGPADGRLFATLRCQTTKPTSWPALDLRAPGGGKKLIKNFNRFLQNAFDVITHHTAYDSGALVSYFFIVIFLLTFGAHTHTHTELTKPDSTTAVAYHRLLEIVGEKISSSL